MRKQVFLAEGLWQRLEKEAQHRGLKRVAVAYTSSLDGIRLGEGDILVTDASPLRIAEGSTLVSALQHAAKRKCTLYSLPRLHAKVYILPHCTIIGSSNLSTNTHRLDEAAVLSDHNRVRTDAVAWFNRLLRKATRLTPDRLNQLSKIKVVRRFGTGVLGTAIPTLLEALEQGDSIIHQFIYSWFTTDAELSFGKVKREAKERDLLPSGKR